MPTDALRNCQLNLLFVFLLAHISATTCHWCAEDPPCKDASAAYEPEPVSGGIGATIFDDVCASAGLVFYRTNSSAGLSAREANKNTRIGRCD